MNLPSILLIAIVLILFVLAAYRLGSGGADKSCCSDCGSCKGCDLTRDSMKG